MGRAKRPILSPHLMDRARPDPAHKISRGWATARPDPIKISEDGPRPDPANHIFSYCHGLARPGPSIFRKSRPGLARPITFSIVSVRPGPARHNFQVGPARLVTIVRSAHDKPRYIHTWYIRVFTLNDTWYDESPNSRWVEGCVRRLSPPLLLLLVSLLCIGNFAFRFGNDKYIVIVYRLSTFFCRYRTAAFRLSISNPSLYMREYDFFPFLPFLFLVMFGYVPMGRCMFLIVASDTGWHSTAPYNRSIDICFFHSRAFFFCVNRLFHN